MEALTYAVMLAFVVVVTLPLLPVFAALAVYDRLRGRAVGDDAAAQLLPSRAAACSASTARPRSRTSCPRSRSARALWSQSRPVR